MTPIPCFQVNAFTDHPFSGNPAAVCLLREAREAAWMQAVAAEMNLAETAFVRQQGDQFELRWFTPEVEVDLCGHATLASAFVLWQQEVVPSDQPIRFSTRSGILTCTQQGGRIQMNFPATLAEEAESPEGLAEALGVVPRWTGRSRFDLLVLVDSEDTLRNLKPDFRRLGEIPTRGFIVTAPSFESQTHFVSRFFGPSVGVDEDPVTGSAHCCLGPYWGEQLGLREMVARQISQRGGTVHVTLQGDRVLLGGQAVMIWQGEVLV